MTEYERKMLEQAQKLNTIAEDARVSLLWMVLTVSIAAFRFALVGA